MKLRIRGNSLRLRLSRPETRELAEGRVVTERVGFGPTGLTYRLVPYTDAPTPLSARFDGGEISVAVHADIARDWVRSEAVALEAEQKHGEGESLSILVEKDFHCLSPRSRPEDERDLFPNPNHGKACG